MGVGDLQRVINDDALIPAHGGLQLSNASTAGVVDHRFTYVGSIYNESADIFGACPRQPLISDVCLSVPPSNARSQQVIGFPYL